MLPHGHRRAGTVASLLFIITLLISTTSAASAVLGIDLGTEYFKAALVKPGIPLEIVLTKDSKRKEAAAVAFKPLRSKVNTSSTEIFPERLYGGDAVALSARFPSDVYLNLKPLLGLSVKDNGFVQEYGSWHPGLKMVAVKERGTVGFKSESFIDDEEPFTVEELLAMELQNIKSNADIFAGKGSNIKDVVISVPGFYTAEERRAVQVAADLAGLKILAMTSDGLSIGLNYATSRTFPVPKGTIKPEYHLVYDMGAGSTTATVLKFQGKTVKDVGRFNKTVQDVQVLGIGWDKSLGGDAFNGLILEDMVIKFADSARLKSLGATAAFIREDGRTMAKLWKEAERIRQVLSANIEASSSFEGLLYDDVTFKYKLTRAEFEKLTAKYLERVRYPIMQALSSARLAVGDIESIVLHGGAVRTPFVQNELERIIGSAKKVRTNVNSDEAACFGAAFKAAGISPSFRVKEIHAGDVAAHGAGLLWVVDGKERHQKIFQPSSHTGTEKQVPFKVTEDFVFTIYQQVLDGVDGTRDIPISRIQTLNLTASVKELTDLGCVAANMNASFSIRLSPVNGIPEVTRGSITCEPTEIKKADFVDNVKGLFGFGSKKSDLEVLEDTVDLQSSTLQTEAGATSSSVAKSSPSEAKSTGTKSTDKPKDSKNKIEVAYIGFSVNETGSPQFTHAELLRMKDRMASFEHSDRSRKLREEALNTLEGYTYKVRDIVEDEGFVAVSTEQQRAAIVEKSQSASEWLYGEGADASREDLKARLKELRDLVDHIQRRKDEAAKLPQEVKSLMDALNQTQSLMSMVKMQAEKASEAASLATASLSSSESAAEATPESTSTTDDGFADLDDDTSTTSPTPSPTPKVPEIPLYSMEDFAEMSRTHDSVKKWLDDKLAQQEALSPYDDPVLTSSDIAAKSKELNKVIMEVLQKKMQIPGKSKSSSKKKTSKKTKKSKTASATSTTEEDKTASTTATTTESEETVDTKVDVDNDDNNVGKSEDKEDVKDEL